jgi:hypothetical protein
MRKSPVSPVDQGKGEREGEKNCQQEFLTKADFQEGEDSKEESCDNFACGEQGIDRCPAISASTLGSKPRPKREKIRGGKATLARDASGWREDDGLATGNPVGNNAEKAPPEQTHQNIKKFQKKILGNHEQNLEWAEQFGMVNPPSERFSPRCIAKKRLSFFRSSPH